MPSPELIMIDPTKLSNEQLLTYRTVPKQVINPREPWKDKPARQRQRILRAKSFDGVSFLIYCRKNLDDTADFSCGLKLLCGMDRTIILVRYNGYNHRHGSIDFKCHIHYATVENVRSRKYKDERYAEETTRYKNVDQALDCLIKDCGIRTASLKS